jgi:hypothetical protein
MNLVYYAHSYRKPDADVVGFFSDLMRSEHLIASLDPPSDHLNSAKPERHLGSTDGMVAVLTAREGGVSQYILYEISLCLRARKPLLVFVEDLLPGGLVPARVLQRRFSRRGVLRQLREHQHALRTLKSYIGEDPPAKYQPSSEQRRCLLAGLKDLTPEIADNTQAQLVGLGYSPILLGGEITACLYEDQLREKLTGADLAIAFMDASSDRAEFFLGGLHGALTPTILLSANRNFPFHPRTPIEYQARIVDYSDGEKLKTTIAAEISIFEEEYVDLQNQDKVARYKELLITEASRSGEYQAETRNVFVQELHMGDQNINYGQAGAIGRDSTGTINNYEKAWQQIAGSVDLNALAAELSQLRGTLRQKATTVDEDKSVATVAEAETEAKNGNGPGTLAKLAKAGTWVLEVAKEIGVPVAVEVLKKSIGL